MGGIGDFLFGSSGQTPEAFRGVGYQQQGRLLNQLLGGQAAALDPSLQGLYNPISFNYDTPELNFTTRNPYQFDFSYDPTKVADAYSPQAKAVEATFNRRGREQDQAILQDMNRRGLATAGATTEELSRRREATDYALNQALSALAGQQAQAQNQANQFAAQLEAQRQAQQAAEVFRQQGATDAQAQQLANLALQNRQFQFTQNQLPIENLMRLYGYSTGATPGYQGQPGMFGGLLAGAGSALGGPIGGAVGGLFGDAITNGYWGAQKGQG